MNTGKLLLFVSMTPVSQTRYSMSLVIHLHKQIKFFNKESYLVPANAIC